jgi:hypothetical protein
VGNRHTRIGIFAHIVVEKIQKEAFKFAVSGAGGAP